MLHSHPSLTVSSEQVVHLRLVPQFPIPAWADNKEGRALLSLIRDNPPETSMRDACGFKYPEHSGKPAKMLRDLFDRNYFMPKMEEATWMSREQHGDLLDEVAAYIRSDGPYALVERCLTPIDGRGGR